MTGTIFTKLCYHLQTDGMGRSGGGDDAAVAGTVDSCHNQVSGDRHAQCVDFLCALLGFGGCGYKIRRSSAARGVVTDPAQPGHRLHLCLVPPSSPPITSPVI